jgi:hypothetical protein
MFADDEAAGVLKNGSYVKNPTAKSITEYIYQQLRIILAANK